MFEVSTDKNGKFWLSFKGIYIKRFPTKAEAQAAAKAITKILKGE